VMLANNDAAQPIWVTEMSWASGGPPSSLTVTPAKQNAYLVSSWDTMLACRARWNLQHVLWFALQDESASTFGTADYWGYHNGLLNVDGSPKSAYASFLQFIGSKPLPEGRGSTCTLPGGVTIDTTEPVTSITAVRRVTNNTRSQPISFSAEENGQPAAGVHFQCSLDGGPWQSCGSPFNAASARQGDHALKVRAIDPQGNVGPSVRTTWLVDLTSPSTRITSHSRHASARGVFTVRFVGSDPGGIRSFQCRVDKHHWKKCRSPYRSPRLQPGHHKISVRAIDRAGNVDPYPATVRFTVHRRR